MHAPWNSIQFKYMDWNLNWIPIQQFKIQLKRNEMQIGGEGIENLLVNAMLEKKLWKDIDLKKHLSMSLYLGMG